MKYLGNLRFAGLLLMLLVVSFGSDSVHAQQNGKNGFVITLESSASSKELNAQEDLWVLEVSFKPMRMIEVDIVDPKTKEKKREYVWYLIYKAVNRPLERRIDTIPTNPQNDEDPIPRPQFVPEFTLVTEDNDKQNIYADVIIPEAEKIIFQREHRKASDPDYKNTVDIVGDLPEITPYDSKLEKALYGMVIWRGVDSKTDYFTVYMTGFTSAYRKLKGPNGEPLIVRRVIQQQYWRPGDRFDQFEREIRRRGEPKWIERPDELNEEAVATAGSKDRSQKVAEVK